MEHRLLGVRIMRPTTVEPVPDEIVTEQPVARSSRAAEVDRRDFGLITSGLSSGKIRKNITETATIPFNRSSLLGRELQYIFQTMTIGQIAGDQTFSQKCHAFLEATLECRAHWSLPLVRTRWRCAAYC